MLETLAIAALMILAAHAPLHAQDVPAPEPRWGFIASVGGETGVGSRVKLRLEARAYLAGFEPLVGHGSARTGNDLTLLAGLRPRVR